MKKYPCRDQVYYFYCTVQQPNSPANFPNTTYYDDISIIGEIMSREAHYCHHYRVNKISAVCQSTDWYKTSP